MLGHADLKFRQIRAKDYILFKKIEKKLKGAFNSTGAFNSPDTCT